MLYANSFSWETWGSSFPFSCSCPVRNPWQNNFSDFEESKTHKKGLYACTNSCFTYPFPFCVKLVFFHNSGTFLSVWALIFVFYISLHYLHFPWYKKLEHTHQKKRKCSCPPNNKVSMYYHDGKCFSLILISVWRLHLVSTGDRLQPGDSCRVWLQRRASGNLPLRSG